MDRMVTSDQIQVEGSTCLRRGWDELNDRVVTRLGHDLIRELYE
jgi:hypothetical protein